MMTHIGYPGGPSLCGIDGHYHGYDPSVSVLPIDFLTRDGRPDAKWCPKCRHEYLEEAACLKLSGVRPHCKTRADDLNDVGLLSLCQGLWMQANGSGDPAPDEEINRDVAYLVLRLAEWHERSFGPNYGAIDEAVRTIVWNTLQIAEADLLQRAKRKERAS